MRSFTCLGAIAALCYSVLTSAAIHIDITQGVDGALPIAVMPLTSMAAVGGTMDVVTEVVRQDLKLSGRFQPLQDSDLPFQEMGSWVQELDITQWRHLGVENVLLGTMEPTGRDEFTVNVKLLDVYHSPIAETRFDDGEVLVQEKSTDAEDFALFDRTFEKVGAADFRSLSHHISDLVYKALTGTPGHFSSRLAYVHVNHNTTDGLPYRLEVSDADGYRDQTILKSPEPIMSPAWSPDGRQIAYVSFENHRAEIYLIEVASGERTLLTHFPRINGAPAWSPDGKTLALVLSQEGSPKIYLLDMATSKVRKVSSGYAIDTEPSWAPDGKSLIFTSSRAATPQIYRLWLEDEKVERLTFEGNYNARASFTPDGEHIVMIHRGEDQIFRVATQDLKSNALEYLTHDPKFDESPTISPNGEIVLYATHEGDRGILAGVSIDGHVQLHLPAKEGSVQEPAWSPFLS